MVHDYRRQDYVTPRYRADRFYRELETSPAPITPWHVLALEAAGFVLAVIAFMYMVDHLPQWCVDMGLCR